MSERAVPPAALARQRAEQARADRARQDAVRSQRSQQVRLTAAAALAVALTTFALRPVFDGSGWWARVLGAIAVVGAAGACSRLAGWARPWQVLVPVLALIEYVCLAFVAPSLVVGVLPGSGTPGALRELATKGAQDIAALATPVPTNAGLLLIATVGIGLVAVLVDLLAVTAGRAVLAGVPLLVLFAVPGAVVGEGVGGPAFLAAAGGWLLLLLAEGQGRALRWGAALGGTRGAAGLGSTGRRIGSAALGVALAVPLLLPGLESRLPAGAGDEGGRGGPSTTTTYNPITRLRADLRLPNPRPILSYRTDDPTPDYLRLTTLDQFTDRGWTASRLSGTPRRNGVDRPLPSPLGLSTSPVRAVNASIAIQGLAAKWLPVPFAPTSVTVPGPWLYDRTSETVFAIRVGTQDLDAAYDVSATRVLPQREQLARADVVLPPELRRYAALPAMTPAVADLTDGIVAGRASPYDRVAALQAYFLDRRNRFVYDTAPTVGAVTGPSALEDFLRNRRGFCEQYASAMAAMIRRAGVPARVAVGFTPGTRRADNSYAVTTENAHAWPEAWFAGAGWVRFEPTPRRDGQTSVPDYARPQGAAPQVGPQPSASASPTTPTPSPSTAPAPRESATPEVSAGADRSSGPTRQALVLVGWVLLAGVLLSTPALVHRLRSARRWSGSGSAVSAGWAQLRDDLTDAGLPWSEADSPRGARRRLLEHCALSPDAQAALDRIVQATERTRYAADSAPAVAAALRADTSVVRRAVLATLPRRWRVRAYVLPASTGAWARARGTAAVAEVRAASERRWLTLTGRLRALRG